MATLRDIRRRIKAIQSMAKITKAMQMVSISKMKRAQQAALLGIPYADMLNEILTQATGTLDLDARKALALKLEKIQQERGSICTPFFMNVWKIYTTNVHGVEPSPDEYAIFTETWKDA